MNRRPIAVLGAGSGGMALSAHLQLHQYDVRLWNRSSDRVEIIKSQGGIRIRGLGESFVKPHKVTTDLESAVCDVELIVVTTTADAHRSLATKLAPLLRPGQIILLHPGRTGGALEVCAVLDEFNPEHGVTVAESQSLLFACRPRLGAVEVFGKKDYIPVASIPAANIEFVIHELKTISRAFVPVSDVLWTGLDNIGATLHPAVMLARAFEIGGAPNSAFYDGMTSELESLILEVDKERLTIASAYDIDATPVADWICKAYPVTTGRGMAQRLATNPAYAEVRLPESLSHRFLTEDVPTGLVPIREFGKAAGVPATITSALIKISEVVLGRNFACEGRTLKAMGLSGLSVKEIKSMVRR